MTLGQVVLWANETATFMVGGIKRMIIPDEILEKLEEIFNSNAELRKKYNNPYEACLDVYKKIALAP